MSKLRGFVLASLGFVFFGIIPLMILVCKLSTMSDMTAWYNERLYIATVLLFMLGRCVCHDFKARGASDGAAGGEAVRAAHHQL